MVVCRQDNAKTLSQPSSPGYLMTVSAAQDLMLVRIHCEQAATTCSASIICFGESVKFKNNILLCYPPPSLLSVCVDKTIIVRLWVLHTYVMSAMRALISKWTEDESSYSLRLPYTFTQAHFPHQIASQWIFWWHRGLSTILDTISAASVLKQAYNHHSKALFFSKLRHGWLV